jgi:uncharacterized protein with NRDE domain
MRAEDYVQSVDGDDYNGFSLFACDGTGLAFVSNRHGSPTSLGPGLYGLANASLDSDEQRVRELKSRIARMISADAIDDSALLETLAGTPLFIVHPIHGTRCSTAVLIDTGGKVTFVERSFDGAGSAVGEVREELRIDPERPPSGR